MYGDLGGLDRVAQEVEDLAARIRAAAEDHYRQVHEARWVSAAAEAYRGVARTDHDHATRVADGLLRAAASLRDHAARARETWSLVARLDDIAIELLIEWVR